MDKGYIPLQVLFPPVRLTTVGLLCYLKTGVALLRQVGKHPVTHGRGISV